MIFYKNGCVPLMLHFLGPLVFFQFGTSNEMDCQVFFGHYVSFLPQCVCNLFYTELYVQYLVLQSLSLEKLVLQDLVLQSLSLEKLVLQDPSLQYLDLHPRGHSVFSSTGCRSTGNRPIVIGSTDISYSPFACHIWPSEDMIGGRLRMSSVAVFGCVRLTSADALAGHLQMRYAGVSRCHVRLG